MRNHTETMMYIISISLIIGTMFVTGMSVDKLSAQINVIHTYQHENDSLKNVLHLQQLYIEKHKAMMSVVFTVYNPVPEQTDDTPLITASGSKVKHGDLAVSRDFLNSGFVLYGDSVYVLLRLSVRDTMNKRYKKSIDFLHMYHKNMGKNIDEAIKIRKQNGYIFK